MIELQPILHVLRQRGILLGPGHFVLGDGYGNPGHHSATFVDWQKFNEAVDLYAVLVERLAEQVQHLNFDLIVTPDEESLPTARMLAKVFTGYSYRPEIPCQICSATSAVKDAAPLALIHDDFVNRGRQLNDSFGALTRKGYLPVALTCLFTRVAENEIFGLPIYAAVEHAVAATPADKCPLCAAGEPVDVRYGKGALFAARPAGVGVGATPAAMR
jgi:orotate phosphoribosyltransferase